MTMRILIALALSIILASCASPGPGRERGQRSIGKPVANPSAVVAAELAFARLAQEKGQWTAFRETMTDDAVMLTPQLVSAKAWLKGKQDPETAVTWQPHKVYMSCTGSVGVATGAWQNASGGSGSFTTIWLRQKKGDYKWVFDHGVPLEKALAEPDFIETEVAPCKGSLPADLPTAQNSPGKRVGISDDRTLIWTATSENDGSGRLTVDIYRSDGKHHRVIEDSAGK